jgi:hypothetical protein
VWNWPTVSRMSWGRSGAPGSVTQRE